MKKSLLALFSLALIIGFSACTKPGSTGPQAQSSLLTGKWHLKEAINVLYIDNKWISETKIAADTGFYVNLDFFNSTQHEIETYSTPTLRIDTLNYYHYGDTILVDLNAYEVVTLDKDNLSIRYIEEYEDGSGSDVRVEATSYYRR